MEKNSEFRDVFNQQSVSALAERIHAVNSDFKKNDFIESTLCGFEKLTLSERSQRI